MIKVPRPERFPPISIRFTIRRYKLSNKLFNILKKKSIHTFFLLYTRYLSYKEHSTGLDVKGQKTETFERRPTLSNPKSTDINWSRWTAI